VVTLHNSLHNSSFHNNVLERRCLIVGRTNEKPALGQSSSALIDSLEQGVVLGSEEDARPGASVGYRALACKDTDAAEIGIAL
jgi:hypothetical protein